jgi:hypothetical protein
MMKAKRLSYTENGEIMGKKRDADMVLVGKARRKYLESFRRRCDGIKMNLREMRCCDTDLIYRAHDRDQWRAPVNTVTNSQVLQNIGNYLSTCATGDFSRRTRP